jgi:hypothetical protein
LNKRDFWLIVTQKRNDDDKAKRQCQEGHLAFLAIPTYFRFWPSAEKSGAKITPIEYTLTGSNRRSFPDVVYTHFRPEAELGPMLNCTAVNDPKQTSRNISPTKIKSMVARF